MCSSPGRCGADREAEGRPEAAGCRIEAFDMAKQEVPEVQEGIARQAQSMRLRSRVFLRATAENWDGTGEGPDHQGAIAEYTAAIE